MKAHARGKVPSMCFLRGEPSEQQVTTLHGHLREEGPLPAKTRGGGTKEARVRTHRTGLLLCLKSHGHTV